MKQILLIYTIISVFGGSVLAQVDPAEQKISVLLGHRYSGGFEPHGYEKFTYTGLFKEGESYFVKSTKIKIETSFDKCSGDSIFATKALTPGECLFLFCGLDAYKRSAIESHYIAPERRFILPDKNYIFNFNKDHFSFIGEGKVNYETKNIENYKLILFNETKNVKQALVNEEYLDDSKVEILFIGDLDGDEKPDFIINAPPHKDTRNILLFLSSYAEKDEIVHLVSQQFDWFDC